MEKRICSLCGEEKPITDFSWNQTHYRRECKKCKYKKIKEYYEKYPEKKKESLRKYYYNHWEKKQKQRAEWTAKNKDKVRGYKRKYFKKWSVKNREKLRAQRAIKSAIRRGKLIRPNKCEICGKTCYPDAHHYKGYKEHNILSVQWLCVKCHRREDNKRNGRFYEW